MALTNSGSQGSAGHQPSPPTIGTASTDGATAAQVPFTPSTYLGKPTAGTYRAFTQPIIIRSTTGTISDVVQIGSRWTANITGMTATTNLFINQVIAATNGTGSLGSGTVTITAILSSTSISIESTGNITAGTITNILGGIFATNTTTPISVTGLSNGSTYNFRVQLDNNIVPSIPSGISNSVTPFSFAPFSFTPFSFSPFSFTPFSFTPFSFTPFSFTPSFGFVPFGFTPFGFTPSFGFIPSSIRYKEEIMPASRIDFEKSIKGIDAVTWKYKWDSPEVRNLGYIAEQLYENEDFKYVVPLDDEGLPAGIRYDLLSVYAIEALKEAFKKINALEKRIENL